MKTVLFGILRDLQMLRSARGPLERLAIWSQLKRHGNYHHQIQRQRRSALRREGVRRKSLQGMQREERDCSATDQRECHGEDEIARLEGRRC